MKFRYKRYSSSVLRPVVPIGISYKDKSVTYEVLIDSGADICIFDSEIADILGIKIKTGTKQSVSSITGTSEFYYIHEVTLNIGGWKHKAKVGFLKNINKQGYGIVGQMGFFDKYSVKFDLNKEEIELKESINLRLN